MQHEQGAWFGRFVHPELGRLLEELASVAIPGVVVVTSRFPLPTLETRKHAHVISLATPAAPSAIGLLENIGVRGSSNVLRDAAQACGLHAKAVELLGTFLVRYQEGRGERFRDLPATTLSGASAEENHVAQVLHALQAAMPAELQDILALATSFRQPATEARLLEYLQSEPLRHLLHDTWGRGYAPLHTRSPQWLSDQVQTLVELRLLEQEAAWSLGQNAAHDLVLDAHPLARRLRGLLGGARHVAAERVSARTARSTSTAKLGGSA